VRLRADIRAGEALRDAALRYSLLPRDVRRYARGRHGAVQSRSREDRCAIGHRARWSAIGWTRVCAQRAFASAGRHRDGDGPGAWICAAAKPATNHV